MQQHTAAGVKYHFVSLKMDSTVRFQRTSTESKWRSLKGGDKKKGKRQCVCVCVCVWSGQLKRGSLNFVFAGFLVIYRVKGFNLFHILLLIGKTVASMFSRFLAFFLY